MKKGITPIIAMILLILIVVSLGGVFAAWTTRTWEAVGTRGTEALEKTTGTMQKSIIIDNVDCSAGNVYIRNTGSADLHTDDISVYVDDSKITPTSSILLKSSKPTSSALI